MSRSQGDLPADQGDPLARIAAALERLSPPPSEPTDWLGHPAYIWDGVAARPVAQLTAPSLAQLRGIERQKDAAAANVVRLAKGHAAHDMLLWGARGMGKSALVRATVIAAQRSQPGDIALVQVATDALASLPALFARLASEERNFLVFIDDLGFGEGDEVGARHLRSWLEGGVEARAPNIRLAVTANRRAIVPRNAGEQDDPINPRDVIDDRLALADRFGLSLGFHNCDQENYLAIVHGYAEEHELSVEDDDALEWSRRRGARSGRTAWQYIVELAGRAGKTL